MREANYIPYLCCRLCGGLFVRWWSVAGWAGGGRTPSHLAWSVKKARCLAPPRQAVWNSLHCGRLHYHFSNKVSGHLWGECQVNMKTIYLIRTGSDTRKPRGAQEDVESIIALYFFLIISHLKRLCVCSSKCIQFVNNILLSYTALPSLETIQQSFSNCAACNTKTQACLSLRN